MLRFHRFQSVCWASCKKTSKDVTRQHPPDGQQKLTSVAIYCTDLIESMDQVFPTYDNRCQQIRDPQPEPWIRVDCVLILYT